MLLLTTLFFVFVNAELSNHNDCDDDHCPICEVLYITKKCTSSISLGGSVLATLLMPIVYLYSKCSIDKKYYAKYKSLIDNKVRIDC